MNELLEKSKIILVMGSGGVGKTTLAASLGMRAAQQGRRVLVMTIDPSLRLATSLGLSSAAQGPGVVSVGTSTTMGEGSLFAYLLNPEESFRSFVRRSIPDAHLAGRLLNNKLFQQLSTTLSGSQEFSSLERLLEFHGSGQYDLIVLDTPPTQHAVNFLEAPGKLRALFDDSVSKWFLQPAEKQGLFRKVVHRGTLQVLKAMELVTGPDFVDELREFFISAQDLQQAIVHSSCRFEEILGRESTRVLLVASGNKSKNKEVSYLAHELKKRGQGLYGVIVNRCYPSWMEGEGFEEFEGKEMEFSDPRLTDLCRGLSLEYREKISSLQQIQTSLGEGSDFVMVPELRGGVVGQKSLEEFGQILYKSWKR